jgi:hypothetical protein
LPCGTGIYAERVDEIPGFFIGKIVIGGNRRFRFISIGIYEAE